MVKLITNLFKNTCTGDSFSEFYIAAYKWTPKCSDLGLHSDKQVQNFGCMNLSIVSMETGSVWINL